MNGFFARWEAPSISLYLHSLKQSRFVHSHSSGCVLCCTTPVHMPRMGELNWANILMLHWMRKFPAKNKFKARALHGNIQHQQQLWWSGFIQIGRLLWQPWNIGWNLFHPSNRLPVYFSSLYLGCCLVSIVVSSAIDFRCCCRRNETKSHAYSVHPQTIVSDCYRTLCAPVKSL